MPREAKIGATRGSYVYQVRMPDPLRAEWEGYCDARGKKAAPYLRALMRFLIQDEMPKQVRDFLHKQVEEVEDTGPKERVHVRFTQTEYQALSDYAEKEGVSPQRWIINAVRASLTHEPQFTMEVLKGLWESTYQLRAMGRNLNQIAKRMNEANLAGAPIDPPTLEEIEELARTISQHTREVGQVINASLNRWGVVANERN